MRESNCKSCGKRVIFAQTETGGWQVLDAVAPTWSVLEDDFGNVTARRELHTYVSHFVTCPTAALHSRKKSAPKQPERERVKEPHEPLID